MARFDTWSFYTNEVAAFCQQNGKMPAPVVRFNVIDKEENEHPQKWAKWILSRAVYIAASKKNNEANIYDNILFLLSHLDQVWNTWEYTLLMI